MRACTHRPVLGGGILDARGLVMMRRLGRRNMNNSGATGSEGTLRKVCVESRLLPCPLSLLDTVWKETSGSCWVPVAGVGVKHPGSVSALFGAGRDSTCKRESRRHVIYGRFRGRIGEGKWNLDTRCLAQFSTGGRKDVCLLVSFFFLVWVWVTPCCGCSILRVPLLWAGSHILELSYICAVYIRRVSTFASSGFPRCR